MEENAQGLFQWLEPITRNLLVIRLHSEIGHLRKLGLLEDFAAHVLIASESGGCRCGVQRARRLNAVKERRVVVARGADVGQQVEQFIAFLLQADDGRVRLLWALHGG